MAYLLGVDGGTESIRAIVFDLEGRPKGSHACEYLTQFPKAGWAEQHPDDWWRAMGDATRGACGGRHRLKSSGRDGCRYHLLLRRRAGRGRYGAAAGHDLDGRALRR